jgi:hypothetical protein
MDKLNIKISFFQLAQATKARCLLLMGNWEEALESAEKVSSGYMKF